jgi:hypothetical protein
MVPFPAAAHRTGRADFPHPALGRDSRQGMHRPSRTIRLLAKRALRLLLGPAIELLPETLDNRVLALRQCPVLAAFRSAPEPGLRPSTGITRLPRYNGPLRLPQRPEADHFRPPRLVAATHHLCGSHTLPRRPCLRMLTPLPRLVRTGSPVGCSPAPRRPSPYGRRVGSSEKLSRPAQGSRAFRPAHSHLGCTEDFPRGFSRPITRLDCSSGYRANRQFPGRDFHPLDFETQEVSSQSETQLTSNLLPCRTASDFLKKAVADLRGTA